MLNFIQQQLDHAHCENDFDKKWEIFLFLQIKIVVKKSSNSFPSLEKLFKFFKI